MSRPFLIAAALLTLIGLGATWFLYNYDRVPVREWVGMSGEARRNPFLAAQRLATQMGLPARELRSVTEFGELPPHATLVLPALRERLSERDRARVLDWVARGGHLVLEAEYFRVPDPFAQALGVRRDQPVAAPAAPAPPPAAGRRTQRTRSYDWPGREQPLVATLAPDTAVDQREATIRLAFEGRNALVDFPRGQGRVTVVSSLQFMRNNAIGTVDNAELAWLVMRLEHRSAQLMLFNRPERLSLTRFLERNAWAALISTAVLVLLWLWSVVPRFGPVAPDPPVARRRLLDHLRASGRFQWSAGGAGKLVEAAREAALRRVARTQVDFGALDPPERTARLAELTGLAPEDARRVLQPATPRAPGEFIRTIMLFQWVQERLAHKRREP